MKKIFRMRVVKRRHRLPEEEVKALTLKTFKAGLDGALSDLI